MNSSRRTVHRHRLTWCNAQANELAGKRVMTLKQEVELAERMHQCARRIQRVVINFMRVRFGPPPRKGVDPRMQRRSTRPKLPRSRSLNRGLRKPPRPSNLNVDVHEQPRRRSSKSSRRTPKRSPARSPVRSPVRDPAKRSPAHSRSPAATRNRSNSLKDGSRSSATTHDVRQREAGVDKMPQPQEKKRTSFHVLGSNSSAPKLVGPGIVLMAPPSLTMDPDAAFLPWQEDDVVADAIAGNRHWGLYVLCLGDYGHRFANQTVDRYRYRSDADGDSETPSGASSGYSSRQRSSRSLKQQRSSRSVSSLGGSSNTSRQSYGSFAASRSQRSSRSIGSNKSFTHDGSIDEDQQLHRRSSRGSFWSVAESIENRDRQAAYLDSKAKGFERDRETRQERKLAEEGKRARKAKIATMVATKGREEAQRHAVR